MVENDAIRLYIDLIKSSYWQIPLDEESQLKATFITLFGRYCPTRGPFGLASNLQQTVRWNN